VFNVLNIGVFMKLLLIVLMSLFAISLQAKIIDSDYEAGHQGVIEKALYTSCGYHPSSVTQISSTTYVDEIDQGVRDTYYTTILEVKIKIDQNFYDVHNVEVKSMSIYSFYEVRSVQCQL
jgi:hypothetical protein